MQPVPGQEEISPKEQGGYNPYPQEKENTAEELGGKDGQVTHRLEPEVLGIPVDAGREKKDEEKEDDTERDPAAGANPRAPARPDSPTVEEKAQDDQPFEKQEGDEDSPLLGDGQDEDDEKLQADQKGN